MVDDMREPMPEICDLLTQLTDSSAMTRRQFEKALGLGERSGQSYFHKSIIDAADMRRLFISSEPNDAVAVQRELLDYLTFGTNWQFFQAADPGRHTQDFDTSEICDDAARALESAAKTITEYRDAPRIDADGRALLETHLHLALKKIGTLRRTLPLISPSTASASA